MKKVAIVYLVWSNEPEKYLTRALMGVADQTYTKTDIHLLVIYNSHKTDEASQLPFIESEIRRLRDVLPSTTILSPDTNLGFPKGNNLGMQWAIDHKFDYVFLHNADGFLASPAIEELVGVFETDQRIGQAQSLLLLHPENNLINSAGNAWNYLGIGYCTFFRENIANKNFAPITDIDYVSGAATMMRIDLLARFGLWREEFFMYHEDTEYSLRLKVRGYRTVMAARSVFYHQYQFVKTARKFFWIERNRRVLKFLFFKRPTLFFLFPLELIFSVGLFFVYLKNGWWKEYRDAVGYWLVKKNRDIWKKYRAENMRERKLSDRALLLNSTPVVSSATVGLPPWISAGVNAVFTIYYYFLKMIVWW